MFEFLKHMTSTFKKRNALRKAKVELQRRYGSARFYTPGQVNKCYEAAALEQTSIIYAYALFLRKEDFDSLGLEITIGRDYENLRSGIDDISSADSYSSGAHYSGSGSAYGGHGDGGGGGNGGGG